MLFEARFGKLEWDQILETDLWRLSDGDNNINPVLRLSYFNLPSDLKHCFAYCSIFPKGYEFEKAELIKLWMAEGLLKCCGRDKSEEELGKYYFVMHDVVIDLAKSVSGEFCLHLEGDNVQDI
ncbi:CC-NBS-LRR resistance protein, partial [Trifolium medium]|nr:CC-NBS-LRR resistance protein [Trifolium medium]